jgi:hypothetical protein
MSQQPSPDTLGVSRKVLRILIKLNWLVGALILALLVVSLIAPEFVMRGLGIASTATNAPLVLGMRLIMVIGIVATPITHNVLARLLAIVDTVSVGDPFVVENADRLQKIAWSVLALEVLHLGVIAVAALVSTPTTPLDMGSSLSVTRWLAVLLLFVLARVFEQGARMRADLEGTV